MSEKWVAVPGAGRAVDIIEPCEPVKGCAYRLMASGCTPEAAARVVTAVNNHEALVKALDWLMRERCKLMDEDGNCLCGELYACDAPALLAEIKKDTP